MFACNDALLPVCLGNLWGHKANGPLRVGSFSVTTVGMAAFVWSKYSNTSKVCMYTKYNYVHTHNPTAYLTSVWQDFACCKKM